MQKLFTLTLLFFKVFAFSQCFQSVSAGQHYVLGIHSDGSLYGWGIGALGGTSSDYPILLQTIFQR